MEGGNPVPEITWTVSDHLGKTKEQKGGLIGPGLMVLKTGSEERKLTIICVGENTQGRVSHTKRVHTHCKLYVVVDLFITITFIFLGLPASVEITGPTTATPGEYAHFACVTNETSQFQY